MFKVTHSTTLQARIIEAATNVKNIPPALEALMFSIYCITISSLDPSDCQALFGSSKDDLMTSYRFGCHHALTNARFLQTRDRDCLTALFFYLVSVLNASREVYANQRRFPSAEEFTLSPSAPCTLSLCASLSTLAFIARHHSQSAQCSRLR